MFTKRVKMVGRRLLGGVKGGVKGSVSDLLI